MNRSFDFYEFAGIIVPGAILLLGLLWLFPDAGDTFADGRVGIGEFGVLVIVAYAAGHLIQGVGNGIEWLWWKLRGGLPSCRVLAGHLIPVSQHKRLSDVLRREKWEGADDASSTECRAIVREVYSVVAAASRAARVDKFNGNYGLTRGLAASFLVLAVAAFFVGKGLLVVGILGALFAISLQRMDRFGQCYAVELFLQYLVLAERSPAK